GSSLNAAQLQGASFKSTKLQNSSLREAQMQGASFDQAQMQGADLYLAQMQGASLYGTQMQGASLSSADMRGVGLVDTRLIGANLSGAQMQGARGGLVHFQGADLYGANLQGAFLDESYFHGALMSTARLDGARLPEADLQGANLTDATFHGADLEAANVWRSHASEHYGPKIDTATLVTIHATERRPINSQTRQTMTWDDAISRWLLSIPESKQRDGARDRLSILTAPNGDNSPFKINWPPTDRQPEEALVAKILGDLACDASNAPYVARGILSQIDASGGLGARDFDTVRTVFAKRLADHVCAGARGLTDIERARLAKIATAYD
ncbi:MAG: pentapeptide repeat-containing protein, partial [Caldilinea sp.]